MEGESGPFSVLFFFVPLKEKALIYPMTTMHGKIKFPLGKGTDIPYDNFAWETQVSTRKRD